MGGLTTRWSRIASLGAVVALVAGACGGSSATSAPPASTAPSTGASTAPSAAASTAPSASAAASGPKSGGTVYLLTQAQQFDQVDPQRAYTGEDMAFFQATIYRSLEAYTISPDNTKASQLTPDLATDLGTPSNGAKTWTFTLRDGVTFQDGSPITCADVKYGTSRTFATDVISGGPTYAIQYLDIPSNKDGSSQYPGPYKATAAQQALFDKAVTCSADNKTITFNLNQPVADFNYTVTLGFSPVPKAADTGESYGVAKPPVASGPYEVQSYQTGNGGKMILVRNPNWSQASDPYRHPYPDQWEVDFGLDPQVMDQRMIQSTGNDQTALMYGGIMPQDLATVFVDPNTAQPQYAGRVVNGYDPYARYIWINVQKITNQKIREAMAVALDRASYRKIAGGEFVGDLADGVIKPNLGMDYAPTNMWTTMFGQAIPDGGDPAFAKQLISQSGAAAPTLTFNYADTPTYGKIAAAVQASLQAAGFTVNLAPIPPGNYYSTVFDPKKAGDFGIGGWGADWPNASTVIPPLFTVKGGWDLSQANDPTFNTAVAAANAETDRPTQAKDWQALNTEAMQKVWAIPTLFGKASLIMGSGLATGTGANGGLYIWGPYGSNPYGDVYVK